MEKNNNITKKEMMMALETLKNVKEVNGHEIVRLKDNWPNEYTDSTKTHINIDDDQNIISFKIQKGPIKEVGHNGCQVDEVIETAKVILEGLNKNYPCRENAEAITKLDEALMWLDKRKKDRAKRGVEGRSEL